MYKCVQDPQLQTKCQNEHDQICCWKLFASENADTLPKMHQKRQKKSLSNQRMKNERKNCWRKKIKINRYEFRRTVQINTSTSNWNRYKQRQQQHTDNSILENYNLSSWNNIEACRIYGNCMLCTVKCNSTWCSFIFTRSMDFLFSFVSLFSLFSSWNYDFDHFYDTKRKFSIFNIITFMNSDPGWIPKDQVSIFMFLVIDSIRPKFRTTQMNVWILHFGCFAHCIHFTNE